MPSRPHPEGNRPSPAPRALIIEVHCSCGQVYHADPAHAGRSIRCRCGKSVPIPAATGDRAGGESRKLVSGSKLRGWWRRVTSPTSSSARGSGGSRRSRRSRNPARQHRRGWPALRVSDRIRTLVTRACWTYLGLTIFSALFMWTEGDAWWPASMLLFGPRWVLLLPLLPLVPAALLIRPKLMLLVFLGALITLGPVMGYRTGWRAWLSGHPTPTLRVITFNAEGEANPMSAEIPAALLELKPDVIAIEECPPALTQSALWPADWTVRTSEDGICMASRFPVREARPLEQVHTGDQGGTGIATYFSFDAGGRALDLVIVHLETPRKGLESLRYAGQFARMQPNIMVREIGAAKIRRWIDQQSKDVIVTGDFNMPVESRIYRASFGDCTNAHSTVGHGFGWTRVLRRFSARIDHVVSCGAWTALDTRLGPDLGSDHLPLIVDLRHP